MNSDVPSNGLEQSPGASAAGAPDGPASEPPSISGPSEAIGPSSGLPHSGNAPNPRAEASPAVWLSDANGRLSFFEGPASGRGAGDETLRGRLLEGIHPDDFEQTGRLFDEAVAGRQPFDLEYRQRALSGPDRWQSAQGRPRWGVDGEWLGYIGTLTDQTDRRAAQEAVRESESRVRLAMEAADLVFWDWDRIRKTLRRSPEHHRMVGPELENGSFESFAQRVHPEDRAPLFAAFQYAISQGKNFQGEFRIIQPDGVTRWIAGHGNVSYDALGNSERVIGVVRDITERVCFEQALQRQQAELQAALTAAERARDEAEAAGRAKDQFLAVLSHELRTPLTPVLMAVYILQAQPDLSPKMADALQMIRRNIQLESRLIDDLLDITRIAQNKLELQCEHLDLHQAIWRAVEICQPEAQAKDQVLEVQLEAERPQIYGDQARLQQVFWNLLKNAIKFTPPRGSIRIHSENHADRLVVTVTDNGIGIAPEVLPRVFNAFEQGDRTIMRQFGGLGLGLTISMATVAGHGGRLSAASAGSGCGATFTLELNVDDAPPSP